MALGKQAPSAQGYADKPFEAFVDRVAPTSEKLTVDSAAGPDDVVVPHPMLSTNSWIRALPERGARVITVATAGGTLRRVVVGYFSRASADLISRYNGGSGLYRPLKPGEWDLMTPGVAYIYGTVQGKLHLRGGPSHVTIDPQRLHIKARTPTFRRELHEKLDNAILDEERFGVVVRHTKPPKTKNRWLRAPGSKKSEGEAKDGSTINKQAFAKEYTRIFGREGNKLSLLMEGDLFDDAGKELKHSKSARKLRMLRELYDTTGKVQYQYEVDDEKGAIALTGNADTIDVTQKAAAVTADITKLLVKMSQSLTMTAQSSTDVTAKTTARFGGTTATNIGPQTTPVDFAMLGTTFNATVMTPLLAALVAGMKGLGIQVAAAGATITTVATKVGSVVPDLAPAGVSLTSAGGALQALSGSIQALTSALPPSLSTNVKISKA